MSARTIQLPEDVYQNLMTMARGNVPKYLAKLIRGASYTGLDVAYREMATAEAGEIEPEEWHEGIISDVGDEAW